MEDAVGVQLANKGMLFRRLRRQHRVLFRICKTCATLAAQAREDCNTFGMWFVPLKCDVLLKYWMKTVPNLRGTNDGLPSHVP